MKSWIMSGHYAAYWPVACLVVIAAVDDLVLGASWLPLHGLADEVSNVLTAGIWIAAARKLGLPLAIAPGIIAAVLIDLDHVPDILGWFTPPDGTSRPVTHSLGTVLLVTAVALTWPMRRAAVAGAAMGLMAHLLRDLGTGTVLFWWPLSTARVSLTYDLYFAVTSGLAAVACLPVLPWTSGNDDAAIIRPAGATDNTRESANCGTGGDSCEVPPAGAGASRVGRHPQRTEALIANATMNPDVDGACRAMGNHVGGRTTDAH
jgi:inner membrane protein